MNEDSVRRFAVKRRFCMRDIAEIDPVSSRRVGYREDNHLDVSLFGSAAVPNQPFWAL